MEGFIFNLWPRALNKFSRTAKGLERYRGATYSNICQPVIMTDTTATFPDSDMPKIIPDTSTERPKKYMKMTYPTKKSIDNSIRQKLSKKDVYEINIHTIYNIIVGQKNEPL